MEQMCFEQDQLSRKSIKNFLAKGQTMLLLEGFLIFIPYKHCTRIYDLAVLPEFRGKGVARRLIEQLGDGELRAECKRHLQAFYEKLGFKVVGETPNYYENGDPCLRMRRP